MIPVRLSLNNFMCYRDNVPPLQFDGIHLACISGDNGNGKSTLIDAITWAVWGKARTSSGDDLIYQGAPEMSVEFDFQAGDQLYRVMRRRARPKKRTGAGKTSLEFQALNNGAVTVLTGATIQETEAKIIDTLHMSYDTFINSAFLRQGHADEFSTKRPGERKEVLADILQLSLYDDLAEQSRKMGRDKELELAQVESTIRDIDTELAEKAGIEQKLAESQLELDQRSEEVKAQEAICKALNAKKEHLKSLQAQAVQLQGKVTAIKKDRQDWQNQVERHQKNIKDYEQLIGEREKIESCYASYLAVKQAAADYDEKHRQWSAFNQQRYTLEKMVTQAKQVLERDRALAESRVKELSARANRLPELEQSLQKAETFQQQLEQREQQISDEKEQLQEIQKRIALLDSAIKRYRQDITEIDDKLKLLSGNRSTVCPLCNSELGEDGVAHIEKKYAAEREKAFSAMQTDIAELTERQQQAKQKATGIAQSDKQVAGARNEAQKRSGMLGKEAEEAAQAKAELEKEQVKLESIITGLTRKQYAVEEQTKLASVEASIAQLAYDEQKHTDLRRQSEQLQASEEPKKRLDEAVRYIEQEKESLSRAEGIVRERQAGIEQETVKLGELEEKIAGLAAVERQVQAADERLRLLQADQHRAREAVGSSKARLERCNELEERRKMRSKQIDTLRQEQRIYGDLARAFGKSGIQATLIETALPEIENEANRLLARMTDNRMHVKLESQRQTKKGDTVETLDITISDELGTRSYEMFSGGEAFRINFAIRIALSRLLAQRAGAPLRTLIIDEGFGTQDTTGLEKVKEAIASIQNDFDTILVITHIEELRDAFPARITVVKTASGSTIEVS